MLLTLKDDAEKVFGALDSKAGLTSPQVAEAAGLKAYPIGSREPARRLLAACARDPRIISTLSPGSRATIREKLGMAAPRHQPHQARELAPTRTEPVVVNRHHYRGKRLPEPWLYIGRNDRDPSKASPLRNPFDVRRYGKKAIVMYRDHLRAMVEDEEPAIMAALLSITPAHHLVCSCAPRPCHGDVVVEVWSELQTAG